MSHKIFRDTYGGDTIRLIFSHTEDARAFESVERKMHSRIINNEPREETIRDFQFDTTLEAQVANERIDDLKNILGLQTLNIYHKDSVTIIPLPTRS